jgi:hypothetical protein
MNRVAWALAAVIACGVAHAIPVQIPVSGQAADAAGQPLTGPVAVTVALYAAEGDLTPTWSESLTVTAVDGAWTALVGEGLGPDQLGDERPWLGLTVDGAPLLPRQRLAMVPFAITVEDLSGAGDLGARLLALEQAVADPPASAPAATFSTPGDANYAVPDGVFMVRARLWGGGGGGGGDQDTSNAGWPSGGGGGGGYTDMLVRVSPGEALAVRVGAGGAGGPSAGVGAPGGASWIGPAGRPLAWAEGGGAGWRGGQTEYMAGGRGGSGATHPGSQGGHGGAGANIGGHGGRAGGPGGDGGAPGSTSGNGAAGSTPGGGGGGIGWSGTPAAGAGAAGRVVIEPVLAPDARATSPVVFSAPGPALWRVPAGLTAVTAKVWGGGGGGGGSEDAGSAGWSSAGGGGGGYSELVCPVEPGGVLWIDVGYGGNGGVPGAPGPAGGLSRVGTCAAAGGGRGGEAGGQVNGGGGGAGGVGATANGGAGGVMASANAGSPGGAGAAGGGGGAAHPTVGQDGAAPGGGGGGVGWTGQNDGGDGAHGRVELHF